MVWSIMATKHVGINGCTESTNSRSRLTFREEIKQP